jgi:hypothetical protein
VSAKIVENNGEMHYYNIIKQKVLCSIHQNSMEVTTCHHGQNLLADGCGAGHKSHSSRNGNVKSNSVSGDKTKRSLDNLTDVIFDVGDNQTIDRFVSAKKRQTSILEVKLFLKSWI